MIKTYRLRNLLMTEQITGPELETLLQKKDYLGALYDLRNDRVWMADILQHPGAVTTLAWSQTAIGLVGDQVMPVVNKTSTAIAALVARLVGLPYGAYIDMAAVAASQTAMAAVAASQTAMAAVIASQTAMAAVAASQTAMAAVIASQTAMAAVVASQPAMAAVTASQTAMAAVTASQTAMAAVVASQTAMAAVTASQTAMAAVIASQTAMAAVTASQPAMAAVVASQTAMAAVNNSSIAKNAFFTSPKKRSRAVGTGTWVLQDIVNGRGVFVRYQGQAESSNRLRVDNTKDITVEGADFFKIIPYTSKLQIYCYHSRSTVHYIPFGA